MKFFIILFLICGLCYASVIALQIGIFYGKKKMKSNIYKYKYINIKSTGLHTTQGISKKLRVMDPRKFEILCAELLKSTGEYKHVELTSYTQDGGKDIILTDKAGNKVYVECKRYTNKATSTEGFMIGREICQKLIGAMTSNCIFNGIIMTTGNVHYNATEYINNLHRNSPYRIKIITMDGILDMLDKTDKDKLLAI